MVTDARTLHARQDGLLAPECADRKGGEGGDQVGADGSDGKCRWGFGFTQLEGYSGAGLLFLRLMIMNERALNLRHEGGAAFFNR